VAETAETVSEGRKGDGTVTLVQDNAARQITILSINEAAANQLGYPADELIGRKLEVILGGRTATMIEEDLEYEDDAPDLVEILSRHREIRLRPRSGSEITIPATLNRVMAEDRHPRFQMILPNEREGRARSQLKDLLKTGLDGHTQIDEAIGIPNRATAEAYIRLIGHYLGDGTTQAAFAVLRLDRYDKSMARYGADGVNQLLQHVANCCRATFRSEDVVCSLGGNKLGLLLVDISRESVRLVLNRLRWNIRTHTILFGGKADFSSTVSIAFGMLGGTDGEQLLAEVEKAVDAVEADTRNTLVERAH
jgi:diguanylate cyclase (GGDEF)-like protein